MNITVCALQISTLASQISSEQYNSTVFKQTKSIYNRGGKNFTKNPK